MPLVFLPEPELLFLWGQEPLPHELGTWSSTIGATHAAPIVTPSGLQLAEGVALGLLSALEAFAAVPASLVPAAGIAGSRVVLPAGALVIASGSSLAVVAAGVERKRPTKGVSASRPLMA